MKGRRETKKKRRERGEMKIQKSFDFADTAWSSLHSHGYRPWPALDEEGMCKEGWGQQSWEWSLDRADVCPGSWTFFLYSEYFFFFFFYKGFLQSISSHCILLTITGNSNKPWFLVNGNHPSMTWWMAMS